jgi:photosystem II stability/assembly factor-like uncharacterized protein/sugar lactone lactonase YvrE
MKYKERTAAVAMVVVLLTAGVAMSQVMGPDGMMKGIEFTRTSSMIPYNSAGAYQSLDSLHATGANWVTIVPVWWMADTGRSAIYFRPDSSPSDTELGTIIHQAHQLGMSVFLKPEIRCSTGVWIGHHKPHSQSSWFNYYRVFIMHYAQLAQTEHCQMFSVGSELDSTTTSSWDRGQWAQTVYWVKGKYLGPVTYAADWRSYRQIPFWDSLDLVGINAYFPLWNDAQPWPPPPSWPVGNLSWYWDNGCIPGIESLRVTLADTLKPIIFTEIGYRSISGCSHEPWNNAPSGTYDATEQRNCYMAALHSLLGKPWFAGWFWHEWTTNPYQGGTGDLSYSPRGKPAQEVLRRWFAAIGTQRGACMPSCSDWEYQAQPTHAALESLAASHASWVGINSRWIMDDTGADFDTINPRNGMSPRDNSIDTAIQWAHEAGLNVCLKCYLACPVWCNDHEPNGNIQWFKDESVFVTHYAQMAEQDSCEMLAVGMEINKTANSTSEAGLWRDMIISAVRAVYSGPLTYGAASGLIYQGADTISRQFWDAIDIAGIDPYYPLFDSTQYAGSDTTSVQHPNAYDLRTNPDLGWEHAWIPKLDSLYRVIQKPITFQEIGYRSMDSAAYHAAYDYRYGWQAGTSGTSHDLYSVCFPVDTMTGYAVGDSGTILKTTNSGGAWGTRNSGTSNRLYSVDFPAADTGYAVGGSGTILKTTDGWSSHEDKAYLGVSLPFYSVCFPLTPSVGYVVGGSGVILKTTNGGNSWTRLYCVRGSGDTVRVALRSVSLVVDGLLPAVGYIAGDSGTVLKSTDGGTTWHVLSTPVTVNLHSVSLVSPETCFAAGDSNHLIWTTDGGATWADSLYRTTGQIYLNLQAVCVPECGSARFTVGSSGVVLRAGDGWKFSGSWQVSNAGKTLRGVGFHVIHQTGADDRYVGFAVGDSGTILKASNGGRMIADFNEQTNCYEATFESFWGTWQHPDPLPWFYGFYWWYWVTDPTPLADDHEVNIDFYTPQQKPAGATLRKWYDWTALQPHDTLAWMARRYPTGSLDLVTAANDKVDEPLVLCRLESNNWEEGGSADSARLLQEYYGLGDTVINTDSTPWFHFVEDTSWRFLHARGVYCFYAQYMDVPNKVSPPYLDFRDSLIMFDTTGPTGTVLINNGTRFAISSTCSLRLAAHDSASGVASMRFTNGPKVNLVQNGLFAGSASSWSFAGSGSGYDSALQMARLSVGSSQSSVRQFIPAESISAHSGDSCVLEANVMALMHGGNASGSVSLWFWKTRQDTSLKDTAWTLVDSAEFTGGLLSPTGLSNLSKHFLLTTPSAESGWSWRGGMVRVEAHGMDTAVGRVWTDDISLDVFHPQTGDAWFGSYDTLSQWDIGSGAGRHIVTATYRDSSGSENSITYADTIMLDPTPPVVHISQPSLGQIVNGTLEIIGWAYDSVEVSGDSWFLARRLFYRSADSTNWRPVLPDSCSHTPAYPDWQHSNPAVHLGYWNTTPILNGQYWLKLTASDSASNSSSCSTWVMVQHGRGGGMSRQGPAGGGTGVGQGSLYAGSSTGCVLHLSDNLDSLDCFQVTDSGSQAYVTAVLEVGNDSILVLDARNKRVHKLHRGGQGRRRLVSGLSAPMGLTRDDDGNFWLLDKGTSRVGKFRSDGTLVFVRGGFGSDSLHFHSPEGIAVKGSLVYVADTKNDRIVAYDTSGDYKATITGDFENPTSVMVTDEGTIYLTDGNDGNIKGITLLGGHIVTIVSEDSSKLRGLVPSDNGHWVFTLAPQSNEVYKLQVLSDESMPGGVQSGGKVNLPRTLALNQPFPNPARTRFNIAYALPRQTRVELKLYDVAGKLVTTLAHGEQKPGYYNLTWNRQDTKGRSCACGVYFCTLSAEGKRFSRKVILTE